MANAPRLVVRTHAPLRRLLLVVAAVALACMALFVAFEWGRTNAGFDGRSARLQRSDLRDEIGKLEAENRRLRLQYAAQESERVGQVRERAELARTIGDLQAEVAQATSDLAFYRSIAGDKSPGEAVKIQELRVKRAAAPDSYLLRLVLGRPLGREDSISGTIRMTFEGTTVATPVNLDLSSVSGISNGELPFSYRYSQTIEQPIQLPAGFSPARTVVQITPGRKGVNPVQASFVWTVDN
jgi:hypothetical protein